MGHYDCYVDFYGIDEFFAEYGQTLRHKRRHKKKREIGRGGKRC